MIQTFTLECVRGKKKGHSFTFSGVGDYRIGRKRGCDLPLPDETVSGSHCLLTGDGSELRIRDSGSTNGTRVGGRLIREALLHDGDMITLGDCCLRLVIQTGEEEDDCSAIKEIQTVRTVPGDAIRQDTPGPGPGSAGAIEQAEKNDHKRDCKKVYKKSPIKDGNPPRSLTPAAAGEDGRKEMCRCELCGREFPASERVEGVNICPHCMEHDEEAVLRFLLADTPAKNRQQEPSAFGIPGYRCLRKLGEGSFGAVWLVEETASGRRMALKTMLERAALQEVERRKFEREMQICCQLKHPNIVEMYDSGCADGQYYMMQEFCAGGSLMSFIDRTWIRYAGKLPVELALHVALQVLDALEYAHHAEIKACAAGGETEILHGVVHRDIHPGNIFLAGFDDLPEVKVGDWGLAKAYELAGLSGISVGNVPTGTQDFACMQQHLNFRFSGPEVDVWSAAAVLFFMLTGQPPRGRDMFGHLSSGSFPRVRSIGSLRLDLPEALKEAMDYTLAEQPRLRVLSAAEFRERISDAVSE